MKSSKARRSRIVISLSAVLAMFLVAAPTFGQEGALLIPCPDDSETILGARLNTLITADVDGYCTDNPLTWECAFPLDDGTYRADLTTIFPDGFPFYGTYTEGYINVNGNISFGGPNYDYLPGIIPGLDRPTLAPFFADVDLRGTLCAGVCETSCVWDGDDVCDDGGPGATTTACAYATDCSDCGDRAQCAEGSTGSAGSIFLCNDTDNDRIIISWLDVGPFDSLETPTNSFQAVITNTNDVCTDSFEVEYRYADLNWHSGEIMDTLPASVGFDSGTSTRCESEVDCDGSACIDSVCGGADPNSAVAVPGSGSTGVVNIQTGTNVDEPGVWRWRIEDSVLPRCGNETPEGCEECDDGNDSNNDACTNLCLNNICGDTFVLTDTEECDDGNLDTGDRCDDNCACEDNFAGPDCTDCDANYHGGNCDLFCDPADTCSGHGTCNDDASCECADGWYGDACDVPCDPEVTCNGNGTCNDAGTCTCTPHYTGDNCTDCEEGWYGAACDGECACDANECNWGIAGDGECGCGQGFTRVDDACVNVDECAQEPGPCPENEVCTDTEGSFLCECAEGLMRVNGVCTGGCGDGNVELGEACDPGITEPGDEDFRPGCRDDCTYCGDGFQNGAETCDDGNFTDNDGCTANCTPEDGWNCSTVGNELRCSPVLGDGNVVGDEQCDDGNLIPNDGCTNGVVDAGWICNGEPSVCTRLAACGDGNLDQGEGCDDGNFTTGDGCNGTCAVEEGWLCDGGSPTGCVRDNDGDSIANALDNCPDVENTDQADSDSDGVGDACEAPVDDDTDPGEGTGETPNVAGGPGGSSPEDGCGCQAKSGSAGFLGLLLLGLFIARARRRSRWEAA